MRQREVRGRRRTERSEGQEDREVRGRRRTERSERQEEHSEK